MDTRLQIVERLYQEEDVNHVPRPSESDAGDSLSPEFQAMSLAKFWMDHRSRQRPDAAVVDRIVEAAGAASRGEMPGVVRVDRSPLRLLTSPRFRMAVAATLVVAIAGIGVWRAVLTPSNPSDTAVNSKPGIDKMDEDGAMYEALAEREEAPAERKSAAPAFADAYRVGDEVARRDSPDDSSMRAGRMNAPAPAVMAATATDWDESDELIRLRQRIDLLQSRQAGEGWDKPVVPLEMMPTGGRLEGVYQAGSSGN